MEPGDALFFHCNLLHRSDQNRSDEPALVADLLLQRGPQRPVPGHHHPRYTPLAKVPDAAIRAAGLKYYDPAADAAFLARASAPAELQARLGRPVVRAQ